MIARYTFFYTGLFLGLSNLMMVILTFLDLEGSSGMSVAMTMVSAMLIGQLFVTEQKRMFTKKERRRLAAAFTLAGLVASIVLLVFISMFDDTGMLAYFADIFVEMAGFMLMATLVVLLLLCGVNWLGLGLGGKLALKQQAAKSEKE